MGDFELKVVQWNCHVP